MCFNTTANKNVPTPTTTSLPTALLSTPSHLPSPLPSPAAHPHTPLSPLPNTPRVTTPSLSHLLTSSHPLPSPSATPPSHPPQTHKTPPTVSKSTVQQVTLPKASIANFDQVNLQSLFSVATNTLTSEGTRRVTNPGLRGRGRLHTLSTRLADLFSKRSNTNTTTVTTASRPTTTQGVVVSTPLVGGTTIQRTCAAAATISVSQHVSSVCVTTSSLGVRNETVKVVNSVRPRLSVLIPTSRQQLSQGSSVSTPIPSPLETTGAAPLIMPASVPTTSLQAPSTVSVSTSTA